MTPFWKDHWIISQILKVKTKYVTECQWCRWAAECMKLGVTLQQSKERREGGRKERLLFRRKMRILLVFKNLNKSLYIFLLSWNFRNEASPIGELLVTTQVCWCMPLLCPEAYHVTLVLVPHGCQSWLELLVDSFLPWEACKVLSGTIFLRIKNKQPKPKKSEAKHF